MMDGPVKEYPNPKYGSAVAPAVALTADKVSSHAVAPRTLEITAIYNRGAQILPLNNMKFFGLHKGPTITTDVAGHGQASCEPGATVNFEVRFENNAYKIVSSSNQVYVLKLNAQCGQGYTLTFATNSKAGNVVSIFETVERARAKLSQEVGLAFWNDRVNISWPARSTYTDLGFMNIVHGSQYEVVGHELGHAVADLANINEQGACQGTQCSTGQKIHLIEQCYNDDFGFSEGWAHFFSAWLYLDPKDPDAGFVNMVARRSPISLEKIPSDVCTGPSSEWRVAAFLWDLIDQADNGEKVEYPFAKVWNAFHGRSPKNVAEAANLMIQSGFSKRDIDQVWLLDFLTPRR